MLGAYLEYEHSVRGQNGDILGLIDCVDDHFVRGGNGDIVGLIDWIDADTS